MALTIMTFRTGRVFPSAMNAATGTVGGGRTRAALFALVRDFVRGSMSGSAGEGPGDVEIVSSVADPAYGTAALALSGGAGAVGGTINGVTVTATFAVSDTQSCGLAAAAINASVDPLVQGFVRANNLSMLITLASVPAGVVLNIAGCKFTSTAAATGNNGEFSIAGTDAQDATALAVAINTHPMASRWVYAVVNSATVRLFAKQFVFSGTFTFAWPTGTSYAPPNVVIVETGISGSGITLSGTTLAASAFVGVCANFRGVWGNAITFAASGTGMTSLAAQTRLLRGQGGAVNAVVSY